MAAAKPTIVWPHYVICFGSAKAMGESAEWTPDSASLDAPFIEGVKWLTFFGGCAPWLT